MENAIYIRSHGVVAEVNGNTIGFKTVMGYPLGVFSAGGISKMCEADVARLSTEMCKVIAVFAGVV